MLNFNFALKDFTFESICCEQSINRKDNKYVIKRLQYNLNKSSILFCVNKYSVYLCICYNSANSQIRVARSYLHNCSSYISSITNLGRKNQRANLGLDKHKQR
jgi:hypothetical protein